MIEKNQKRLHFKICTFNFCAKYYRKDAKKTSSEFFRQKFEFCHGVHKLASIEQKEMDEH